MLPMILPMEIFRHTMHIRNCVELLPMSPSPTHPGRLRGCLRTIKSPEFLSDISTQHISGELGFVKVSPGLTSSLPSEDKFDEFTSSDFSFVEPESEYDLWTFLIWL
jgi:hypothetical protein